MRPGPAVAAIELASIPAGVHAVDALLKASPVAFLRAGTITRGRFLALFGGSTAATDEALRAALAAAGEAILDRVLLSDVHPALYAAVQGGRERPAGSLAVLETATVAAMLRAVERALKGTPVRLAELRAADAGLAGKAVALLCGDLPDVQEAVELARDAAGERLAAVVIPAPHDALLEALASTTSFAVSEALVLEGEGG